MNIGIIGAGVTGLTAAYDLTRQGHRVTLYEARPYVGGLAAGFKDEAWDWSLERFYHHIFASDRDIITLVKELGIADMLFFPSPVTSILKDGKCYPINKPLVGPWLERLPLGKTLSNGADLLATALRVHDLTVWWDRGLEAGQNYESEIRRELQSARVIVPLWCLESVMSRLVLEEARTGLERGVLFPSLLQTLPTTAPAYVLLAR